MVLVILGHGVNQFLWCMSMMGCGLRKFFIGYFHFLPLAKIPPVVINNSIPLSGYYYFFSSVSHSWLLVCQLGRSHRCRMHTCWQPCRWKKLTVPTSTLLLFHSKRGPWTHSQGREEGQTEAKVQIVWIFALEFRIILTSQMFYFTANSLVILGDWMRIQTHHHFKGLA